MRDCIAFLRLGDSDPKYATIFGIPLSELTQEELIVVCAYLGDELKKETEQLVHYQKHQFDGYVYGKLV